jgi:glutathione peroxidase-family protein
MKSFFILVLMCTLANAETPTKAAINKKTTATTPAPTLFDFKAKDINGKEFDLAQYKGKVTMIVNTASSCGFTPQLKELQDLQTKYGPKGFAVIAFPSNDFKQDTGSNAEIAKFASDTYKITFPLMDKNPVSGDNKQPIYKFLTDSKSNFMFKEVKWNFEKFLVGKDGKVLGRWTSEVSPTSSDVIKQIERAL